MKNERNNLFYLWRNCILAFVVLSAEMVKGATFSQSVTINNGSGQSRMYQIIDVSPTNDEYPYTTTTINNGGSYTGSHNTSTGWSIKVRNSGGELPSYSVTKAANGSPLTFTDNGTGGEPPAAWKYHYNVCNNSPYKRNYKIMDSGGVTWANITLDPGECAEGTIAPADGQKRDLTVYGTQYGTDGDDTYGVADIPTNDPGWYQDGQTPPNNNPNSDKGQTPPDSSSNSSTNIYFVPNTSDLAKEKTLQTVGNVLHNDITQGLGGVQNGLKSIDTKLGRIEGKLTDLNNTTSSGFSTVNTKLDTINSSLTSVNSSVAGLGGKLDSVKSGIDNVTNILQQFKDENHGGLMQISNKLHGIKDAVDIVGTNTTQTNYFTSTNSVDSIANSVVNEATAKADSMTQGIRDNHSNLSTAAKGWGGSKTIASGGNIWMVNLPDGGGNFIQVDCNPMNSEALSAVVPWIRFALLWICKALFVVWCYRIITERYDSVIQTPSSAQAASGGSFGGKIGAAWTVIRVIFRVVAIPAMVAILTHFMTSQLINGYMTDLEQNLFTSQSTAVLAGLTLLNWFAPITEVMTMFAEGMSFWFAAMAQSILWSARIKAAGI